MTFILGGKAPSTLDAIAYGLLSYIRDAPVIPPDLHEDLTGCPGLMRYLELMATYLRVELPTLPPASGTFRVRRPKKEALTEEQKTHRQQNIMWLVAVGALVVGYTVLGGMINIDLSAGEEDDQDGESALDYSQD